MMFVSQDVSVRYLAGNSEATGFWSGTRNRRWVRTLSHPGAAICITAACNTSPDHPCADAFALAVNEP